MKRKAKGLVTICLSLLLIFMNILGSSVWVYAQGNVYVMNPNPRILFGPGETKSFKFHSRALEQILCHL